MRRGSGFGIASFRSLSSSDTPCMSFVTEKLLTALHRRDNDGGGEHFVAEEALSRRVGLRATEDNNRKLVSTLMLLNQL